MRRWVNIGSAGLCAGLASIARAKPEMPKPPASVVERTVTIRLVDPDGEPVVGWPMRLSTSYTAWRNQAWAGSVDEQGRHPEVDFPYVPPLSVSDEEGVILAKLEFFDGYWDFGGGTALAVGKRELPAGTEVLSRAELEEAGRRFSIPPLMVQTRTDPELMTFEIRAERVVQVHATLVDHRHAGARQVSGRLWRVERGPRKETINFDDVPDGEDLDEMLRHMPPDRGSRADHADDPVGSSRIEELNAIPGYDHVLIVGAEDHLCWLLRADEIEPNANLGRFAFDPPAATGILDVRLAPGYLDPETEVAVSEHRSGLLRSNSDWTALVSMDGSYVTVVRAQAQFDFRTRNEELGLTGPEFDTRVPPGDYYILDAMPFDSASHGMRFALLVELLRGNQPDPGELPTITVVEGLNPFIEIEMAEVYNALKAWYDKRFPRIEAP